MLGSIDLNNKSYEQLREEAVGQISIYSRDWTNYNASDPGITILENFSAFMALQQSEINEVPDNIKWRLLCLAGMQAQKGSAAKAFVRLGNAGECSGMETETALLPAGSRKLYAQDICFELGQGTGIRDMPVLGIRAEGLAEDSTAQLLDSLGVKGGLPLLGEKPSAGSAVIFYLKNMPDAGQKTAIYFEIARQCRRNRIAGAYRNPFAAFRWEIKTHAGYVPFTVADGTCCLLQSGYVVFSLDRELCNNAVQVRLGSTSAYVLRVMAQRASYDMTPFVSRVCGLLVEAVQKDTRSDVMVLKGQEYCDSSVINEMKNDMIVRNEILSNGYLELYGKEADGSYHRYYDINAPDAAVLRLGDSLRTFRSVYMGDDTARLLYDAKPPQELLAVCRDETLAAYRSLGILYGYDGQRIALPPLVQGRVYPQEFSVLVVEQADMGDTVCHVVEPENRTEGEVWYSVSEADNALVIHDCGSYEGAELRLGKYAVYMGSSGNIRAGTKMRCGQLWGENCTDTLDGRFEETLEQVRSRFVSDVEETAAMVTALDCARIMKRIQGLCIHKTGVFAVPEKNEIHIAVKPDSSMAFPKLSAIYRSEIERYLEKYRMLTTRIVIEQPVYVAVNVTASICFKKHFGSCVQNVESALLEALDGIHSDAPFGSRIVFHELYSCLEAMDCVEEICALSILPDNRRHARVAGLDIFLAPDALYYCGSVQVESVRGIR